MRATLYRQLFPEGWKRSGLSPVNLLVCVLIVMASLAAVLETEASLREVAGGFFFQLEVFFALVFSIEYLLRLYAAGEDPRYHGLKGRIRYIFSFWALVDLLAIAPFFMGFIIQENAMSMRLLRVARLLRLSRLGRFSRAWESLVQALHARMYELLLSLALASFMLVVSAACLYAVEARHQPEAFGSIPRALWWSIATLTTVGYGDVTPLTPLGKVFAGFTAVAGIGIIAMPTGILAAAFSDAFQKQRNSLERLRQIKRGRKKKHGRT
ncbi:potassium channel family protein [Marinospirillum perlucidum]|uniref:potassium channel family protein n=1 Tax=Marinospirillum perlucidum TaxID=1982602 RepID=UPI000DF49437|nr:potassium channel family protein [Marinospirillum perlucidum]